jgi:hypothetical protein
VDDGQSFVVKMNAAMWARFVADVGDVTPEEAEWHLASLERGAPMPNDVPPELQQRIDSVPLDFEKNSTELANLYARFLAVLRQTPLSTLQLQTQRAYGAVAAGGAPIPSHFLGFHQATHLASHLGQIRALRNLYRKTRGELARFHPDNPTFAA